MRVSKKDFYIASIAIILLVFTSNAIAASGTETLRKLAFDEAAHRSAALQTTAREDYLVSTHIRFIKAHFGCQDDDIEVLSMPIIQDGLVGLEELRRGAINFIYRVRTADAVVRVRFAPSYGHKEQLELLCARLFQNEPNPNSPIVPISELGVVALIVEEGVEIERLFVIMPFVRGESLPSYLAAHPEQVFLILKEALRTPFEFHRHAVLVKDYKGENFNVNISDSGCPVKFFDYTDEVTCLQGDEIDAGKAQTEIENLVSGISEVLRPFGTLIAAEDRADIEARLNELTQPLGQSDRQEVERIYNERIFPLLDELIAKYSAAPINAVAFAREAIRADPSIAQHIQTIAAKFNVAESGVEVLSVPSLPEGLGGIHGGSANFVYHIPERDVVARILDLQLTGGHLDKMETLRTRLFPDGPNNDTRVVPVWEIGEMTFERHNTSVTLPYVLMPFVKGESLSSYLAENPQGRLWALLEVMRNIYEFHRRLVLTVDYKPEHFKVDTSNANFPVRLFDYVESSAVLDLGDPVQRTMVWRWVQYNRANVEDLISSILAPISGVIEDQDLQAIQPLLAQLMQPLSDCNGQEVERIYGQEIFPFFERLMKKYESLLATAQPVTTTGRNVVIAAQMSQSILSSIFELGILPESERRARGIGVGLAALAYSDAAGSGERSTCVAANLLKLGSDIQVSQNEAIIQDAVYEVSRGALPVVMERFYDGSIGLIEIPEERLSGILHERANYSAIILIDPRQMPPSSHDQMDRLARSTNREIAHELILTQPIPTKAIKRILVPEVASGFAGEVVPSQVAIRVVAETTEKEMLITRPVFVAGQAETRRKFVTVKVPHYEQALRSELEPNETAVVYAVRLVSPFDVESNFGRRSPLEDISRSDLSQLLGSI